MFNMNDPRILEMLRMYQQPSHTSPNRFNPILGEDAPFAQEQLMTQPGITQPKNPWGDYAMYAAMGAKPVADSILSNRRPQPQFASAPSLGSKPQTDIQNFYAMFRGKGAGTNSILARLLRNR